MRVRVSDRNLGMAIKMIVFKGEDGEGFFRDFVRRGLCFVLLENWISWIGFWGDYFDSEIYLLVVCVLLVGRCRLLFFFV